jgi:hypothetical protein
LVFSEKKIKMAPTFNMAFFLASLSRSSRIRQKVLNAKIFAYSGRTNSKKNNCCTKINSKWPLNSRWLPKLNLLVKTTNHLTSKTKKGQCCISCLRFSSFVDIFFQIFKKLNNTNLGQMNYPSPHSRKQKKNSAITTRKSEISKQTSVNTHKIDFYTQKTISTRRVWFNTQCVVSSLTRVNLTRSSEIFTRRVWWMWLRHSRLWFQQAQETLISTRMNVILTLTSVITTRMNVIITRRVWFLYAGCDLTRRVWSPSSRQYFWHVCVWNWHSRVW